MIFDVILKLRQWYAKIIHFEYWNVYFFYAPIALYVFFLGIKSRALAFFTAVNPAMALSGVVGANKSRLLLKVPSDYLPRTLLLKSVADILPQQILDEAGLCFPLICKPDNGERGRMVQKVANIEQLNAYRDVLKEPFIIQEYIDYPLELGIFYYKMPDKSGSGIVSIVQKRFLTVKGDGQSRLCDLLWRNQRAVMAWNVLKKEWQEQWQQIVPNGVEWLIQPIGNHWRGTEFMNANHLINSQLVDVFDRITASIDGFHYGRFDLRVPDLENLYGGKNIKIMEINGVESEAGHIYDTKMSLRQAYGDTAKNMRLMCRIAQQNKAMGVPIMPFFETIKTIRQYLKQYA